MTENEESEKEEAWYTCNKSSGGGGGGGAPTSEYCIFLFLLTTVSEHFDLLLTMIECSKANVLKNKHSPNEREEI